MLLARDFENLSKLRRSQPFENSTCSRFSKAALTLRALLAHPTSEGLNYAGAAFIALGDEARTEFLAALEGLTTSWAAFKSSRLVDVKWCQPKLTVRVKHLVGSKMLRHATVKGFR